MLEKVKLFLRVEAEYTEEDELIKGFIDEAKEYCFNAIGFVPEEENPIFARFIMLYVANAYDNRELAGNSYEKTNYNFAPLLVQLKYCYREWGYELWIIEMPNWCIWKN